MRVLTPVVIAFGITALKDLVELGQVRLSVWTGGFIFGMLLLGLNEVSPEVAMAFAWVAAITAVLVNGTVVFKAISGGVK